MTTTDKSISFEQIRALRREACEHGDDRMARICDLALGELDDADDYEPENARIVRSLARMTREQACGECAQAIADAEAQD